MVGLQSERLEKASPKDSHIARLSYDQLLSQMKLKTLLCGF